MTPPFAERLLLRWVTRDRDALAGDLAETFARRCETDGLDAATWWYRKEVALAIVYAIARGDLFMTSIGTATERPFLFVFSLGLLGGGAQWAGLMMAHDALVLPIYIAVILIAGVFLRSEQVQGFARRFAMTLGSFMLTTAVLYAILLIQAGTPRIAFQGHAWRIAMMLAIGSLLSLAIAQITATRKLQIYRE